MDIVSGLNALNEQITPSLKTTPIKALEQGVWTVISYFSLSYPNEAIELAKTMDCSVDSIHEFDWKRLEEVFASRKKSH